ncbi:MAG: hypothetical protein IPJ42_07555 [Betaproteobacteria bacterium]|nr:hypothetical protein [Betaproteobacteria bacterium]
MKPTNLQQLPSIDSFRLEWISGSAEGQAGQIDQSQLEQFLDNAGLGREARIKTRTKLKVLCLEPRGELKEFMDRGISFAQSASSVETQLIFAWGAVVANYPFFSKVAELVGRLRRFLRPEIHRREEQYGERHNVKVARQSFKHWWIGPLFVGKRTKTD